GAKQVIGRKWGAALTSAKSTLSVLSPRNIKQLLIQLQEMTIVEVGVGTLRLSYQVGLGTLRGSLWIAKRSGAVLVSLMRGPPPEETAEK
ncbi:unnamed protein product, partial [Cyprideis torosa]